MLTGLSALSVVCIVSQSGLSCPLVIAILRKVLNGVHSTV